MSTPLILKQHKKLNDATANLQIELEALRNVRATIEDTKKKLHSLEAQAVAALRRCETKRKDFDAESQAYNALIQSELANSEFCADDHEDENGKPPELAGSVPKDYEKRNGKPEFDATNALPLSKAEEVTGRGKASPAAGPSTTPAAAMAPFETMKSSSPSTPPMRSTSQIKPNMVKSPLITTVDVENLPGVTYEKTKSAWKKLKMHDEVGGGIITVNSKPDERSRKDDFEQSAKSTNVSTGGYDGKLFDFVRLAFFDQDEDSRRKNALSYDRIINVLEEALENDDGKGFVGTGKEKFEYVKSRFPDPDNWKLKFVVNAKNYVETYVRYDNLAGPVARSGKTLLDLMKKAQKSNSSGARL